MLIVINDSCIFAGTIVVLIAAAVGGVVSAFSVVEVFVVFAIWKNFRDTGERCGGSVCDCGFLGSRCNVK
jgi:hypothetical protein